MKEYTYIDLFSGPGGLCTGFISEGFVPRIAVEWSDTTVETYAKSHNAEIYKLQDLIDNLGHLEDILTKNKRTCLIHGDINKVSDEMVREILKKKFGDSVSMDSAATEFTDKFGEGPIKRLWRKIVSKGLTKIKKSWRITFSMLN